MEKPHWLCHHSYTLANQYTRYLGQTKLILCVTDISTLEVDQGAGKKKKKMNIIIKP